jgi:hypothetical protein
MNRANQRRFAADRLSTRRSAEHRTNAGAIRVAIILAAAVATMVWMTSGTALWAQNTARKDSKTQESNTSDAAAKAAQMPPTELVRTTVANEVSAVDHPLGLHMFRSRRTSPKGSQTRIYVETKDALAAMMIANDDKPLTAEEQQGETNHLAWLMNNPDQLRKKAAREKEDEERTLRIVKALPDALQYEFAGTENGEAGLGTAGNTLVKLKFTPNPSYSPPSRVEEVLAGMQGELLIDPTAHRIARIDGTLFREVTFGWGIIGHLNKGGHFRVQQGDLGLGDGAWGITEMSLNMTGKILLFKSLNLVSDEVLSDFQRMPDNLTFAQGVEMLKTEQEKFAHNAASSPQSSEAKAASR